MINALKDKFGTNIKLRSIQYYKIHGTLEEQQARRSSVPILSAIPQPIATRPPRTQIPTPVIPQPTTTSASTSTLTSTSTLSAIPQPTATRPPRTQIPTPITP